jgi:polysaccharide chain length determinant protein (PEP-CTERM system associated)
MDELIRQALDIARGVWHRRWLGVAVAWLVGIVAAVMVLRIPDRYEASARVYVDTQSVLKPLMSGLAVQPNVDQQIAILSRTLVSRPNVERLIRMTDMDLAVNTPRERDGLIEHVTRGVKIAAVGREDLFILSYQDPQPDRALKVVQSLLSIFVESTLGGKRQDTDQARRFIVEQIKVYEKRLEEAENRVKQFKLKYMGLVGGGGQDYFARMTALGEQLEKARLELRAAEQSRDALKRELSGEEPVFLPEAGGGASPSPTGIVPELDARIDALKKSLDDLLRRYTDQHPDVIQTKRQIGELEEERRAEIASRQKAQKAAGGRGPGSSMDRNPVYQQLRVALAESEAAVAALRARVGSFEAEHQRLRGAAQMLPQVEAEYTQLNRDYEVQKRNYEGLVSRRESAALSSEMEAAGTSEIRVIDPPRASTNPVAPNRLALLPMALLAALGAGVAASFLWSQIQPTFHEGRTLRTIAGRPLLGSVSMLPDKKLIASRRRGHVAFGGMLVALLICYGGVFTLLLMTNKTV